MDKEKRNPPPPPRMLFGSLDVLSSDRSRFAALGRENLETHWVRNALGFAGQVDVWPLTDTQLVR
jgi:hypothetical protein